MEINAPLHDNAGASYRHRCVEGLDVDGDGNEVERTDGSLRGVDKVLYPRSSRLCGTEGRPSTLPWNRQGRSVVADEWEVKVLDLPRAHAGLWGVVKN